MAKAIHMMVRIFEETRSLAFYDEAFGLKVAERIDFESFTLIYLRNNKTDFELELTVNKDQTAPYEMGDGYGHLAVCVDDLDAEHARFEAAGLNPRKLIDFKHENTLIARLFFVSDPDGYEIEVLQKFGRYQ